MALLKQTLAVMIVLSWSSASIAGSCLPPVPPWMPTNAHDVQAYADLLQRDAETYFTDVERYFRCLDQERREVFEQVRDFTEDYARVLELLDGVRK
ncbi:MULTISPECIES: hypothetical protein [Roseobacteraceae]|jgi:hypothetical protein|uniref:Secreted protein n=1 Tax=Falsiruegeria mediterranea M17 TaxID=1200281 RepID=A0A2R8C5I4_9RHOB|nr:MULTISPECIES: hypothetical protein [Roseobacteraceae]MBU2934500.1 hypothetical protein [Pacificibacter marinus]MDF1803058.1 hypothetical protein [Thalassovita sp.]MDO6617120.1 hypothetical protein [Pacificibacter sp. 1_MG-2023]SPJ27701.1 hypothetical protein TRM7615_01192 [Falsiruegeria mediterranea M17]